MQVRPVTPGYMETMRIPLRGGRYFSASDEGNAARVAIISEAAARRFWPGECPIGKQLRLHVHNESVRAPRDIIGIVGDVRTRGSSSSIRSRSCTCRTHPMRRRA